MTGIGEQPAEGHRQAAAPAQPQQRCLHLDRIDGFRHADAFPARLQGVRPPLAAPPFGGGETWVTVYMMLSDRSGPQ
ncbi:hypothetical protein GCM10015535_26120 [Streptomyces gelaticus]|uniref:Uncharacterized protein n=1 Tax=Streptomyces gelaticus TaxID=285446 RepID=A0ABQ2W088_9ACTN|nr:hypothetical protein GCM10015535_26120 [Streptomyces gelaticus]